jgi:hypothetical protein
MTGFFENAGCRRGETTMPMTAMRWGAMAGAVATALLSVLGRLTAVLLLSPPARDARRQRGTTWRGRSSPPPGDPFDREQVLRWQARAQAPAAHRGASGADDGRNDRENSESGEAGHAAAVSPAAVLAQTAGPGPEEAATHFARKLMAGLFGRDVTPYSAVAGEAVHFTYGGFWGVLYGLVQSSYGFTPAPFGVLFGLVVWLVGPAWLVPAMRLMTPPTKTPPRHLIIMIAGHVIYGLTVAATYQELAARDARRESEARKR